MEQIPTPERKESLSVRNLLNQETKKKTLEAIVTLEGPEWVMEQGRRQEECEEKIKERNITNPKEIESLARNTLFGLVRWLGDIQNPAIITGKKYVLKGHGGLNHWLIKRDGSVFFEKRFAPPGHVQRARELGFEILEDEE